MVRYLKESDVQQLLTMKTAVELVEQALKARALGQAVDVPRVRARIPQGTLHVLFEADLLPGYAWSFPFADGSANVGFGVLRGGQVSLGQLRTRWNELLARPRLAAILGPSAQPEDPVRAWPIPARLGAELGVPVAATAHRADVLDMVGRLLRERRVVTDKVTADFGFGGAGGHRVVGCFSHNGRRNQKSICHCKFVICHWSFLKWPISNDKSPMTNLSHPCL